MTPREWLRLVLVGLGASVVPLDTAVNIGFPDITRSFGLPIQMIQWVVICYVLTYASLMLAFGRLGDIFGHARVFRTGLAWSALAFLLCAAAPAYGWLLFCRFLQGIGAGLVISVAPALVTGLFPESRRSRAVAAFTMIFALASAAGPLIGGALVNVWGWPAVFWFRAPIALVALIFVGGLPRRDVSETREPLDLLGAVLLALTISSVLLFINQVSRSGTQQLGAILLFIVAAASSFSFVRREARFPAPIVNLKFFHSPAFASINLASVLVYLTSFSILLFLPYYLVGVMGLPLPWAGAILAVSSAGTITASPAAARLIEYVPANRIAFARRHLRRGRTDRYRQPEYWFPYADAGAFSRPDPARVRRRLVSGRLHGCGLRHHSATSPRCRRQRSDVDTHARDRERRNVVDLALSRHRDIRA